MSGLRVLAAMFLSASLLVASAAQAMEIRQYDKMASQDRNEYVAELIEGAQKVLIDEGKSDLAAQVNNLFTETPAGDDVPLGITEFRSNLDRARVADAERAAQDPNAHRLEVEDAMLVTFKKNNIPMSQDFIRGFRAVTGNFRPKFPPQQ
jgi:hypothetical protein